MRQIIACAEVPMTHICGKDEGAHFHSIFGCCERATALSSSQLIQQSSGYPLADILSLSSAYVMRNQAPNFTRSCARLQSFQLHEKIMQKTRQVGQRLAVELLHLVELYYITTNCVQWYILARCMRQCTYSTSSSSTKSEFKEFSPRENVQSPSFRTEQMIMALIICISNLKKAQKVAAAMSDDFIMSPF